MGEPLDGKALAMRVREEVAAAISRTLGAGPPPGLAVVLVGDDPASAIYVRNKGRACAACGIETFQHTLPGSTTEAELLALVRRLNADDTVHGILVQLPLPAQIHEAAILDAVDPLKDVDGFHPVNAGLLAQGRPRFIPCTPLGILAMLRRYEVETAGKRAVVLGRSNIVGRPMATLLSRRGPGGNATTTIAHSYTRNLDQLLRDADIVVAAMGQPRLITADMIRPGAVLIDVGMNRLEDGTLCGDLDYVSCVAVASLCTPVPGGVGPMTIAMLMQNTAQAWSVQTGRPWPAPWDVAAGSLAADANTI